LRQTLLALPRLLLFSYFEPKDVPTLLAAVRRARLPAGVPVYFGSYGPSVAVAREVATLPEGRYAPMFALTNEWFRQRRRLPPEQEPLVSKRLAGQVPPLTQLGSTSARVSWASSSAPATATPSEPPGMLGPMSTRGSSTS
jgi:hypothetical protein